MKKIFFLPLLFLSSFGFTATLPNTGLTNQITLTTPQGVTTLNNTAYAVASALCMKNSSCVGKYFGVVARIGAVEDMIYFKITALSSPDNGIFKYVDTLSYQYGGYAMRFGGSAGGSTVRPSNSCTWQFAHTGAGACGDNYVCYGATSGDLDLSGYRVVGYIERKYVYNLSGGDNCCPDCNGAGTCTFTSWCSALVNTAVQIEFAPTFINFSTNSVLLLANTFSSSDITNILSGDFGDFNGSTQAFTTDEIGSDLETAYSSYMNNQGVDLSYSDVADVGQGVPSMTATTSGDSYNFYSTTTVNIDLSSVTSAIGGLNSTTNALKDSVDSLSSFLSTGPVTSIGDVQTAFDSFQIALASVPIVGLISKILPPESSSTTWRPCFDFDFSATQWAKAPFQVCLDSFVGWSFFISLVRWSLLLGVTIWGVRYIWGGY